MASKSIPVALIEYLLLGKTPSGVQRYMQDGGVVTDVWIAFAKDLLAPVRVLLSPAEGATATDTAFELNRCLKAYRNKPAYANGFSEINAKPREPARVAALDNFVAATIYVDELLRGGHAPDALVEREAARSDALQGAQGG
jgi:hypothetical protein